MKGIKFDDGKVRPSLVFDDMKNALNEVIRVAEFGARKYAAGNWLLVDDGKQRYKEAKYRHAMAQLGGRDEESCLLHLAHEAWNVLALLELQLREEYGLAESSKFQGDLFIPEQAEFDHDFDTTPEEVAKLRQLLSECLELHNQIALLSDDIELVNAATALALKIEQ